MKNFIAIAKSSKGFYYHVESSNFKTKKAYKEALEQVGVQVELILTVDQVTEIHADEYKANTFSKQYVWETDFEFQGEISDKATVGNIVDIEYHAGFNNLGMVRCAVSKVERNREGKVTSVIAEIIEGEGFTAGHDLGFDGTYFKRMATVVFDVKEEAKRLEAEKEAEKQAEEQERQVKKELELKEIKEASNFNETEQKIIEKLIEGNMEWHKRMSAKLKEDGHKHWHDKMLAGDISSFDLSLMKSSKEFARKTFEEDAKNKVIKLKLRVGEIVGSIEKYDLGVANNGDLAGFVVGKKGKARVNIFYAGGYNIQRLHFRATVREVK